MSIQSSSFVDLIDRGAPLPTTHWISPGQEPTQRQWLSSIPCQRIITTSINGAASVTVTVTNLPSLTPPPPLTHHLLVHSLIYPLTHYVSYFCRYHRDQTAPQVLIDPLTNLPTIHFAPSPTSLRYIPSCPLPDTIVTKLPPPLFIALHRWEMYEKRVPLTIDFQGVYPSPSFPLSKLFRRYRHCHYLCRRSLISFPLFLLL